MKNYDVIVIGVGSMGSAACYWLACKGYNVLGIEQFNIPHKRGSHTGQSRIIRKAYFEHPDYVPLLQRAYQNWHQLEIFSGKQVYFKTGLLYHGPDHHPVIKGIKSAASLHQIELNELSYEQTRNNFPAFKIPSGFKTFYEPDAGFILPGKAIEIYKDEAVKKKAVIITNEKVIEWKKEKDCVVVITEKNIYRTKKLIITAGVWTGKLIHEIKPVLKVTRQIMIWIKPTNREWFHIPDFPCWLITDDQRPGALYGFPYLDMQQFGEPKGLKFAWHYPAEETDPDDVNKEITKEKLQQLIKTISAYIPSIDNAKIVFSDICLYANSPDENFIIDHLPGYNDSVIIACGFSGHGFKFVSVIGEILADLAISGKTKLPIEFLSIKRFLT